MSRPHPTSLVFLDGLRGLAALYVAVGHARWLLWEGYSQGFIKHPESYTLPGKALVYFLSAFRYGHQAVFLFFVLSGFVIHLKYSKQLKQQGEKSGFGWTSFVKKRLKRLYPPLIFSMFVTALCDTVGYHLGYAIYRQQTPYPLINQIIDPSYGIQVAAGNLLFLMGCYTPAWGTNGPLWSLMYEWWFYMAYPLFWLISKRSIAWATLLLGGLFVLSFWPSPWPLRLFSSVFSSMLTWWFGVLLADLYTGRIRGSFRLAIGLIVFIPLGLLEPSPWGSPVISDTLFALGIAGFLAWCFSMQERSWLLRFLERLKPLGDMSYTLYVVHFPILVLLSGYVMSRSADHSLPRHFGWVPVGILLSAGVAYAAHFWVEKPFLSTGHGAEPRRAAAG